MKFVVLKFFKFQWPEVNSAPNRQNKTKQNKTSLSNIQRDFNICIKLRTQEKIKATRNNTSERKLLCLWVPAHRKTKTLSQYGTEWKRWSKTAFVYKNLKSVSRSKCTNYELPTYRDEYFLRRLKLQSYPEAVRFLLLLMRFYSLTKLLNQTANWFHVD